MRYLLIIVSTLFILVFLTLVAIPFIFKDDIYAEIEKSMNKNINADIKLDKNDLDISLITSFPNLNLSIKNVSVYNRKPFEGKMLFRAKSFEVNINLLSALSGKVEIKSVKLIKPKINIFINEDGNTNYDIVVGNAKSSNKDSIKQPKEGSKSDFSIKVDHWAIESGYMSYIDEITKMKVVFNNLDHSGSGDFGLSIFDMSTKTKIQKAFVSIEDKEFLEGKSLNIESILGMDLDKMHFSFKESALSINRFTLSMAGTVDMSKSTQKDAPMDVDIRLVTPSQSIKPLLSLIPTVFKRKYVDVETKGNLSMTCLIKGKVSEKELPSIELNMKIDEGEIGYPSLPEKIQELGVDLHIEMKKMLPQYAKLDLKKFKVKVGENPISGKMYLENLDKPYINALLNGHVNLATLGKTVPIDNLTMKGLLDLKLKIVGQYDTLARKMPQINIDYDLKNGYVLYDTLGVAIEKILVKGKVSNETGKMKDTRVTAENFSFSIQDDKFVSSFELWNMDNYHWNYKGKGNLNLNNIQKAFNLKKMNLKGALSINVLGKGDLQSLENKDFAKIVNKGNATIKDFYYSSVDLPQPIAMNIKLEMDPKGINLRSAKGTLGKSSFVASGWIRDYLPYILSDTGIIRGKMNFSSENFNVSEWIIDTENDKEENDKEENDKEEDGKKMDDNNEDDKRLKVFQVPKRIDLAFNTSFKKLDYNNLLLTNMNGIVKVQKGKVIMDHLKFNIFQGSVDMNGEYNTHKPKKPTFNMIFNAKNLKVREAYDNITVINKMVPIAENIDGYFSTNFNMKGDIMEDMSPNLETLYGLGVVELKQISINKSAPIVKILNEQLKFLGAKSLKLKNIKTETKIENGTIETKPFDVGFSGQNARVYGKSKLSGDIDYTIDFSLNKSALSSLSRVGTSLPNNMLTNHSVILPVKVGGTYAKPTCKLGKLRFGKGANKAIQKEVKKQVKSKLKELGISNKDSLNKIINSKDPVKEVKKKADQLKKMLGF